MVRKKSVLPKPTASPKSTKPAHRLWACFRLHNDMPSALRFISSLPPSCLARLLLTLSTFTLSQSRRTDTGAKCVRELQRSPAAALRGGGTSLAHLQAWIRGWCHPAEWDALRCSKRLHASTKTSSTQPLHITLVKKSLDSIFFHIWIFLSSNQICVFTLRNQTLLGSEQICKSRITVLDTTTTKLLK